MSEYKEEVQQKYSNEESVLTLWLPEFQKTVWCIKNTLSKNENEMIGSQLITALQNAMAGVELNDKLRVVLEHISKIGVYAGLTPTETAMYIFSLRPYLFVNCDCQTAMKMQILLDKAGLYTFEVYLKNRDTIIQRRHQDSNSQLNLHEQEKSLKQIEQLATVDRLVAGVAHEINNPLAYIKMNTELLSLMLNRYFTQNSCSNTSDIQYQRPVEAILRGVKRIENIVSDLKSFSRQEPKKKTGVRLTKCLEESWVLVSSNKELASTVKIEVTIEPFLMIYGNAQQLEQVWINIFHNGIKAINIRKPLQGSIRVSAWQEISETEWVMVTVADNGCGIAKSVISRIFEPFYTSNDENGTGLGLSIVQGIIHEHGGQITVLSVVGQGTTFTIKLPAWRQKKGDK